MLIMTLSFFVWNVYHSILLCGPNLLEEKMSCMVSKARQCSVNVSIIAICEILYLPIIFRITISRVLGKSVITSIITFLEVQIIVIIVNL